MATYSGFGPLFLSCAIVHVEFNILNEFFLKMFLIHLGYHVVDHTEAWG